MNRTIERNSFSLIPCEARETYDFSVIRMKTQSILPSPFVINYTCTNLIDVCGNNNDCEVMSSIIFYLLSTSVIIAISVSTTQ